jgi:hypothetical protein
MAPPSCAYQDVLISGAGEMPVREWKSIVYYHNNTPRWNETFKLLIPPHKFRDYHLYFSTAATAALSQTSMTLTEETLAHASGSHATLHHQWEDEHTEGRSGVLFPAAHGLCGLDPKGWRARP